MALLAAQKGSSGGGGATAIEGTYNGTTVTFSWGYDAVAYIIVFRWSDNTNKIIAYGEIGSDTRNIANATSLLWYTTDTWAGSGFTLTSSARSLSLTHTAKQFVNAYLIPLTNTITLS